MSSKKEMNWETLAVHAGQHPDELTGALNQPIYMTSTFTFTEDRMERWINGTPNDDEIIYTYGRSRNPSQITLQDKLAALESAEACQITASGMSAILLAILAYCKCGDHVISAQTVYGGTFNLFDGMFPDMGIEVTFVDDLSTESLNKAKRDNTKVLYFETMANPTLDIPDFEEIISWSKKNEIKTIADSTFTSPYLFRPIEWGVDAVIHSCTKYINGHGDLIGGAIVGTAEYCEDIRKKQYLELGPVSSPMSCFLMTRGLKTLHLRMERHCENAMKFAKAMKDHPRVKNVYYPGLENDPNNELATKYFDGYGGMVSVVVDGDIEKAKKLMFSLKLYQVAVSLGDLDSLVQIPALMTHAGVPKEEREKMGIYDSMIRISVGVENVDDLIADFKEALDKI